MCLECTVEDLITYFVSLPRRRVTKLNEEYEPQQFLLQNYNTNRNTIANAIAERTLNKSLYLATKSEKINVVENSSNEWKNNLDEFVRLEQQKILSRIKIL